MHAMGTRGMLTSRAAGCVDNENMQRIARDETATSIEDVARGMHVRQGFHSKRIMVEQLKREGGIEQSDIDATRVGAIGGEKFVTGVFQKRTAGQIEENRVVFHLAERHEIGDLGNAVGLATSKNLLTDVVQLAPITCRIPMIVSL